MYLPMIPCAVCARHVRNTEPQCPFCGSALSPEARENLAPDTTRRLSRAAAFVFGLTVAGCSSTVGSSDGAVSDTAGATDTVLADRAASDTPVPSDRPVARDMVDIEDLGNIAPPYGIPADAGPPDDDGGAAAEYGAPPMDAGAPDDAGGSVALYGLPPPVDASLVGDASTDDASGTTDDAGGGGIMPLYGAPPSERWV